LPFTLSHAAAVLPGIRRDGTGRGRLAPAVLVAGSFAPDLPYYTAGVLPGGMEFGEVTHAFAGVATVDAVISWALVGLWLLAREPLPALLPRAWQGRPATLLGCGRPRARVRAVSVAWWYVSAVLGALTHVVWDAFTHEGRWGTRLIPAIGRERPAGLPLFSWLQYGCSAAGAAVVVVWAVRALRHAPGSVPAGVPLLSAQDRWWAAAVIGGCATAGAAQRATGSVDLGPDLVPTLCFGAGAGLLAGLLAYAVAVRAWRPPRAPGYPGGVTGAGRERPVAR
jgi:hypothetical protein